MDAHEFVAVVRQSGDKTLNDIRELVRGAYLDGYLEGVVRVPWPDPLAEGKRLADAYVNRIATRGIA